MAPEGGTGPHVVEVTDQNFVATVLDESARRPVIVDFWAEWCEPCRLIGPVLEQLAAEHEGQFVLGKLDIDHNPQAATAFRVQSIPAVIAFRGGRAVNQFIGAIPEPQIRQFIEAVIPSKADRLAAQAEEEERAGRPDEAERLFRQARELDPGHPIAALGLGRLAAMRGDSEQARSMLLPLRPDPEAERLLAAIEVSEWAAASSNGEDPLARAERAAAEGRFQEALEGLLGRIQAGDEDRDAAREAMLKVFSVLGEEDGLTQEYRRRLAAALF